ncbi:hypothetical protein CR513_42580, partial [Mucuna pruriens]
MLDKGSSNIRSALVTGKGFTKRSTSKGKPFTKSSHGEYGTYCKRPGHTKDTYYKLYGKEKFTLIGVLRVRQPDLGERTQTYKEEELGCSDRPRVASDHHCSSHL